MSGEVYGIDGWCPQCGHREEAHTRHGENGYICLDAGATQGKKCGCWRAWNKIEVEAWDAYMREQIR